MSTAKDFRRIVLGLRDVVEGAHMGHADFRGGAGGKVFASLDAAEKIGVAKLTPAQQEEFVRAQPDVFTPAAGAWGRQGFTKILLAKADAETIGEALTLARRNIGEAAAPTRTKATKKAAKKPRPKK